MPEPRHRALDLGACSPAAAYHLLTALVLPRPIAWITTLNEDGSVNLAPFSFFNVVCADPPMMMVSIGRREGVPKDTARNLRARPDFVVNLPAADQADLVQASAADLPYGESELSALGLATLPARLVAPPRLADTPTQLECRVEQWLELGRGPVDLILGRILEAHTLTEALDERGRPRAEALRPLARLSSGHFATLGPSFKTSR
ncbi:MAG: flavin reductase family protein [bacterium]|jgi:flavin reductase (DIM6/NTAB) family NADH-FMN oxidoreductase RutF|nr:flavin reductase family protein [bacterium]